MGDYALVLFPFLMKLKLLNNQNFRWIIKICGYEVILLGLVVVIVALTIFILFATFCCFRKIRFSIQATFFLTPGEENHFLSSKVLLLPMIFGTLKKPQYLYVG